MSEVLPGTGQPNGKSPIPDYENLPYGQDKQLQDAARAGNQVAAGNPGAPAAMPGPLDITDPNHPVHQEAQAMQPADLFAPTARPEEPITAGLPVGPGPGPEAMGQPTLPKVAGILDALATRTNNPAVASLAAQAAASNL